MALKSIMWYFSQSPYLPTLLKTHQKMSFLWSICFHIWTESRKVRATARIFSYSVHTREDTQKIKHIFWCILRSATLKNLFIFACFWNKNILFYVCISNFSNLIEVKKLLLNAKNYLKFGQKKITSNFLKIAYSWK